MRTVCKQNSCTGCMACVGKCKKEAISIQDNLLAYNAVIDEGKCVGCGACERVCPNNHKVNLIEAYATHFIIENIPARGPKTTESYQYADILTQTILIHYPNA